MTYCKLRITGDVGRDPCKMGMTLFVLTRATNELRFKVSVKHGFIDSINDLTFKEMLVLWAFTPCLIRFKLSPCRCRQHLRPKHHTKHYTIQCKNSDHHHANSTLWENSKTSPFTLLYYNFCAVYYSMFSCVVLCAPNIKTSAVLVINLVQLQLFFCKYIVN